MHFRFKPRRNPGSQSQHRSVNPTAVVKNFELLYSRLASNPQYKDIVTQIEKKIRDYFAFLSLPSEATIYDHILLSLRQKDAVFTFNWDPFLYDAYIRNRYIVPLPGIFFLHGNVRIAMCPDHAEKWGGEQEKCSICSRSLENVPLLYPIENKNYSKHPFISASWEAAREFFREAFVLTIFGYSAPTSDIEAVELLRQAWLERSDRKIEHIEVVDKEPSSVLYERWKTFLPTGHLKPIRNISQSWISMYPRRSVEALRHSVYNGEACEVFSLKKTMSLQQMHGYILDVAEREPDHDSHQR